jgi:CheY-like chemotaxis protein
MRRGLAALTMLVVDDNEQVRSIVGVLLQAAGVLDVHYAKDGVQALEAVRRFPIDIAFVDHEMRGMSGLDFIVAVRDLDSEKRFMPLIMMTAHSDMARLNAARNAGVSEFLAKPITADAVMARLRAVLMQPRPFIKAPAYFGPDRRRKARPEHQGPFRRIADKKDVLAL